MGAQYDEQSVLLRFFKNKTHGTLLEVGAADGITHSHTNFLIRDYHWSAVLIEPHPEFFASLQDVYQNREDVLCLNCGILSENTSREFYLNGQISRFLDHDKVANFKKRDGYSGSLSVNCYTLDTILKKYEVGKIDFLSIDAEGKDTEVIESMNWETWRPELVCIEHSTPTHILSRIMKKYNYKFYHKNIGNSFYTPNEY